MRAAWLGLLLLVGPAVMPVADAEQPLPGLLDDIALLDIRSRQVIAMGTVDPETVEGFELLYATPGTRDVSEVAGHLLLWVKLKNHPSAKAYGRENPYDLVLSFLADTERGKPVGTNTLVVIHEQCRRWNWFNLVAPRVEGEHPMASIWQSLKGLAGGFFLVMDRQTLEQAIKHYTVEQDRNLHRYALILSAEQQARLIGYLHEIKANYRQRYYFFSMNCGSALVRVLGEGIGDEAVAEFGPMVSPPHSLVALLVRRGLARRVFPSFHSTTAKGYMARLLFAEEYQTLVAEYPDPAWPPVAQYVVADEASRAQAVRVLLTRAGANDPGLSQKLFRLAALVQEMEMVFDDKQRACEDYTSAATAEARHMQAYLVRHTPDLVPLDVAVEDGVVAFYQSVEMADAQKGSLHSGLNRWQIGGGTYESNGESNGAFYLALTLLAQDMGSPSRVAMQRGGLLRLGAFDVTVADHEVQAWEATGLHLRKFRDTLGRVESGFRSTRGWGLGLRALDFAYDRDLRRTKGTLFGAEALINLASSARHACHAYMFAGANADYLRYQDHDNMTISPLIGAEGLVTFDADQRWQWRSSATYSFATRDENSDEGRVHSSLVYCMGKLGAQEASLGVAIDHRVIEKSEMYREQQERTAVRLELILDRW